MAIVPSPEQALKRMEAPVIDGDKTSIVQSAVPVGVAEIPAGGVAVSPLAAVSVVETVFTKLKPEVAMPEAPRDV
ncbi:hypothetical protein D3C86_2198010 [compost metagenome]